MNFEAVLVGNNVSFSRSCIGTKNDSILENNASNGCSGLHRFWTRKAFVEKKLIPVHQANNQD